MSVSPNTMALWAQALPGCSLPFELYRQQQDMPERVSLTKLSDLVRLCVPKRGPCFGKHVLLGFIM